jgi:UDP-glucose 4-epimerase
MQLFGRPDHKNHSLVVPGTSQKCARNRPQCISQKCARNRPQCILVTGGAGYIGSHTCVALLEAGHVVTVVDNLCNSKMQTIDRIKQITKKDLTFYQKDVTDEAAVDTIFSNHSFDGIIHFAGFKAVGESVELPLKYYYNNTVSTMVLAKYCLKYGVKQFVFSSSATVYGENEVPFVETMRLLPTTNPYGETKVISERILTDIAKANPGFSVSLLRYFNPVGAHESGLIGEDPRGIPNNLMPFITQVAKGKLEKLRIFGNDYPTADGTGVRDYIHVVDLAEGHVAALENLTAGMHVYNLGTGRGTSVLELVKAFQEVNGVKVPYEIVDRRPGDIAECYADASKAKAELGWTAKRGIKEMCRDSWRWGQA